MLSPRFAVAAVFAVLLALTSPAAEPEQQPPSKEEPAATAPTPEPEPPASTAQTPEAESLRLEPLIVSSSRISELDVQIRKLTKKIDRAKKRLKQTSSLDESINADDLPKLLALLGGHTTGQRKSLAADRLTLMEVERSILEALKHPRSLRDEKELKAQLHAIKSMSLLLENP
ncbi:hypothetical protein [Cephaloticoccus primus]|uniref:hypothetical protein n=1 Tax=Cephaloticoccus primus TaxID=1548207 RepID=UPI0012E80EE3|nr:hypothetical protein [Cephaloticoccus primus]